MRGIVYALLLLPTWSVAQPVPPQPIREPAFHRIADYRRDIDSAQRLGHTLASLRADIASSTATFAQQNSREITCEQRDRAVSAINQRVHAFRSVALDMESLSKRLVHADRAGLLVGLSPWHRYRMRDIDAAYQSLLRDLQEVTAAVKQLKPKASSRRCLSTPSDPTPPPQFEEPRKALAHILADNTACQSPLYVQIDNESLVVEPGKRDVITTTRGYHRLCVANFETPCAADSRRAFIHPGVEIRSRCRNAN